MIKKIKTIIEIKGIKNILKGICVHKNINLSINQGEIIAIVGSSGSGKTTLLRNILMLLKPVAGHIRVFDTDIMQCAAAEKTKLKQRYGVSFQQNALFSSLTVLENVMFPLRELSDISIKSQKDLALLKIVLVGLPTDAANKYPAELSGGMQKRAALARAIALDPEILFLDEPTTGLDPNSADALDDLILHLRNTLNLTVVIVTHDPNTLWRISDRVAFLGEGKILEVAPMSKLIKHPHPLIHKYFSSPRSQKATEKKQRTMTNKEKE